MREMSGRIAVEFDQEKLNEFCSQHIPGFSVERYKVVAIRLFTASEIMVTIFAEDKFNMGNALADGKLPVKKFKRSLQSPDELFEFINAYNFTITDGDYHLEDMQVTNR